LLTLEVNFGAIHKDAEKEEKNRRREDCVQSLLTIHQVKR